jgi:hypothetical protein
MGWASTLCHLGSHLLYESSLRIAALHGDILDGRAKLSQSLAATPVSSLDCTALWNQSQDHRTPAGDRVGHGRERKRSYNWHI